MFRVKKLALLLPIALVLSGCDSATLAPADGNGSKEITSPTDTVSTSPIDPVPTTIDQPERIVPILTVSVIGGTGSGLVQLSGEQTTHPIEADLAEGEVFVRWEGDVDVLVDPDSPSTSVILPDSPTSYVLTAITSVDNDLNLLVDDEATSRFLTFASFGATTDDIDQWVGKDASAWLRTEFVKDPILLAEKAVAESNPANKKPAYTFWTGYHLDRTLYDGPSQLRTRMAFALSQILVVGGDTGTRENPTGVGAYYNDVLQTYAFGNFRDLLEAVTYTPAMGEWLTYLGNEPGDPETGVEPDENYARELLQLFTLGLYELNMDGTQKLDAMGDPIETYQIEDIANLARVFTGLTYYGSRVLQASAAGQKSGTHLPMVFFDGAHTTREKAFLGTVIPENTPGEESIDLALDTIFAHPNIAPFISRQLIQRFSASNPTASYVERVANAFEAGRFISASGEQFGDGQRGNLEATLAAILLDKTLFLEPDFEDHSRGKVREPLLALAHWMRTFKVKNLEWILNQTEIDNTQDGGSLQMGYLRSPSVFNFYRPGFVPSKTESGDRGMTVPEFQIADTSSTARFLNVMSDLVFQMPAKGDRRGCATVVRYLLLTLPPCDLVRDEVPIQPDYSTEIALSSNAPALVDHLDTLLTAGRLERDVRADIIEAVRTISLAGTAEETAEAKEDRVEVAILWVILSPAFAVVY